MGVRSKLKHFIFLILKSLHPRYYIYIGERRVSSAITYFLAVLFSALLLMLVIAAPKMLLIKTELDQALLNIAELKIKADFETAQPVSLPNTNPIITLDTTDTKQIDTEVLLLTNERLFYDIGFQEGTIDLGEYDFTADRESSKRITILIFTLLLPSVFVFLFFTYMVKYVLIIYPLAFLFYAFAKPMKNIVTLPQVLSLSFHTATIMILIEVLTIPFDFKSYLIVQSPLVGVYFSWIAITLYLILFVTAIRICGNPGLKN
ncbi:hypothetical protein GOV09_03900 [Candidatus Woesearchaeota archaeon]|nr:hypothetical protein [Candidatus Woesearchaeota archaeon]